MFKRVLFQTHWFVGITAGIVLAIVGLTGALLSFEGDIQAWLNAEVRRVEPQSRTALTPSALLAEIARQAPDKRVQALTVSGDPADAARVMFAPPPGATAAPAPGGRGMPRGETLYADPYTGQLLGPGARGQEFFRTTRSIHRWLTAGEIGNMDVGKHIVGASTALCVLLVLSGLYLRWPRRWRSWRSWFALDFKLRGRSFLWHLHAVLGTWVLPAFLVMSLTGLTWSYEWYRNGLYALAGVEAPPPREAMRPGGRPGEGADGARAAEPRPAPAVDVDAVWHAFLRESADAGYANATLMLPQEAGRPVEIRYVPDDAAHERATNTLAVHPTSGETQRHDRYADKRLGERLVASFFPLHSGSYFGLPGVIVFMLASLAMPVFAITGWMLYLDRRRKKRNANAAHRALAGAAAAPTMADALLLVFASQTGSARELAWQTAGALRSAGLPVDVQPASAITQQRLQQAGRALFVVSTFGEGEPPDDARGFARRLMRAPLSLSAMRFGVLALGDSRYDTFCGFGRALDDWLRRHGAAPLFPRIEVDDGDPDALRAWRSHVDALSGDAAPEWSAPAFEEWRLVARTLLNLGSAGGPTFHVELTAPSADATWTAGDIAVIEIGDGDTAVQREFSIASIAADGRVHLLVRQTIKEDGSLGIGSGWLTAGAGIGDAVRMRVRANPEFRAPPDATRLVLIGNGTGMAGLRSLLKARIDAGQRANWLLFGERNAACDWYYGDEIAAWQAAGWLQHVDVAFSRDQPERVYVQDRLREHGERLRAWIAEGAVVAVCGSADGMAPGVDAALTDVLGAEAFERLRDGGRYRRDVY